MRARHFFVLVVLFLEGSKTFGQIPTISGFSPTSGSVRTEVTITGTNFDTTPANNIVFFGATKAIVTAASTTSLTVTVPVGATYQPITVTVNGLTGYSAKPFIVNFPGLRGIDANSFAAKTEYTQELGADPWSVSIGDLDGDGKADLAVGNIGNSMVSIFLNNSTSPGTITYANKQDFQITGSSSVPPNVLPTSIAIGDLDGDGKLDLAVANEASVISVLRNRSSGAGNIDFAPKVDFVTTGYAASVSIFDIDKDGKSDLAAATNWGLSIFRNLSSSAGSISFSPEVGFVTGKNLVSVSISDLDSDGKADFAVANSSDGFSVFRNTSTPGAISCDAKVDFISVGTSPWSVGSGDFDNDDKPDLAVVNISGGANESVKVFRNVSTGAGNFTFAPSVDLTITSSKPMANAIADIDGDGKLDLVVGDGDGNAVSLFRNKSLINDIAFFSQVDFAIGANARSVSIGDLDGDGKADLAVASGIFSSNTNVVSVLRNTVSSPIINSFSPSLGKVGTAITISGANFSTTVVDNVVKFNGTIATVSASTAISITTSVPTDATKGKITVTVGGQTATSLTDFIVTPQITESFVTIYNKGASLTVSITVDNAANVSAVNFKSRGISEPISALKSVSVPAVGNKFETIVTVDKLTDAIGLTYWFEVLDKQTIPVAVNSTTGKAYVKYALADQEVPISFGNQISNYQIIAVPLSLTSNNVTAVFSSLMPYDKTKWRLFDYTSGDNREYSGFSTIDPGKGYWLIVKTSTTINPGEGISVQADDATPFTINLVSGWNLIGNPYNFRVLWSDVLTANPTVTGVDATLTTFSSGTLSSDATVLEKYRGAFVKSSGPVTLKIPVTRNSSINGGRIPNKTEHLAGIDQENWEIKLTLEQNGLRNEMGGIGMNAKALSGVDQFDGESFSLPFDICALSHPHPGVSADFYKEVVPTHENYTWEFDVKRSLPGNIEMTWNNDYFGDNDKQLMLLDSASLQVIDMKTNNSVTLAESTKKIKILYGSKDYIQSSLDKELPWLGSPYPNPAQGEVFIPFRVPETADQANVQIKVYNSQGLEVGTLIDSPFAKGSYEVKWMPSSTSGLYLIRMQLGHGEAKTVKLIIK